MSGTEIVDESMKRRMEAAEAKVKELDARLGEALHGWLRSSNKVKKLEADNARLREVLEAIAAEKVVSREEFVAMGPVAFGMAAFAREALSSPAPSPSAELDALRKVEEAGRQMVPYMQHYIGCPDAKEAFSVDYADKLNKLNAALAELDRVRGERGSR